MPAFWIELSLTNQHVLRAHVEDCLRFEKIGASPERGYDPLSCEADTSASQLPGLWDRVPVLGASNHVQKIGHTSKTMCSPYGGVTSWLLMHQMFGKSGSCSGNGP